MWNAVGAWGLVWGRLEDGLLHFSCCDLWGILKWLRVVVVVSVCQVSRLEVGEEEVV